MSPSRFPLTFLTLTLILAMLLAACEVAEPGPVVTEPGAEVVEPGDVAPGEEVVPGEAEAEVVEPGEAVPGEAEAEVVEPGVEGAEEGVVARGVGGAADIMVPTTTLMGTEIDSITDEELGTIEDLLIDLSTGNVLLATVEHGGFLDIGDQDLPVPLNALQFSDDTDELRLPIAEETFQTFPDIPDDWPGDFAAGWETDVSTFWSGAGFDTGLLEGVDPTQVAWASTLINYGVNTFETAGFGNVQDLIVNLENSTISYVALSFNDVAAFGGDWRLVPYSAFDAVGGVEAAALTLRDDFDLDLLFDAPIVTAAGGFGTIDAWDTTWDDEIEAYWRDAGIAVSGAMEEGTEATQEGAETAVQEGTEPEVTEEGAAEVGQAGMTDMMLLASMLLDKEVDNLNDEELGTINDLLIDLSSGNILFAVIEHGGFLDIGDSEFPVPLNAMQWGAETNEMIVSISPEMLETFPDLAEDWPGNFGEGWLDQLRTFWSDAGFDVAALETTESSRIVRASELIGYGFGGAEAAGMGNVEDMVVDLASSQVKYMILSFADMAAFGEEWVAVPFNAFDPSQFGDELVFNEEFDMNWLAEAPRVDEVGLYDTGEFLTDWDDEIQAYWSEHGYDFEGT